MADGNAPDQGTNNPQGMNPANLATILATLLPQSVSGTSMAPPPGPQVTSGGMPTQNFSQAPQIPPGTSQGITSQPPSPIGPTNPVQAPQQQGALSDYGQLAHQQIADLLQSGPAMEEAKARATGVELARRAAEMPLPKTGWLDTQGQPPKGGFLHTLARALEAVAAGTVPGRAIEAAEYGPGIRRYAGQQAGIAEQIKALQSQAAGAQAETGTLGQVAGRTIMGGAQVQRATVSADAVNTRTQMLAQKVTVNHQDALARIAAMKDINAKNNAAKIEAQKMRDETETAIANNKDLTAEQIQDMRDGTMQSMLNTKDAADPSIKAAILNVFGVPTAQAPGGAQPVSRPVAPGGSGAPAANNPQKPKSASGPISVTDPEGGVHTFKTQADADKFKKLAGIK